MRMVQFGSMLVMVGSSVYVYLVSVLVTSALSIFRRMGASPVPDVELGVMQTISRSVRLVEKERYIIASGYYLPTDILLGACQSQEIPTNLTNRHSSLFM